MSSVCNPIGITGPEKPGHFNGDPVPDAVGKKEAAPKEKRGYVQVGGYSKPRGRDCARLHCALRPKPDK